MPKDRSLPARFARILNDIGVDGAVLDRFCEAGQLLLDADGAAITVSYRSVDRHTVSSTSVWALLIEDAQDVAGEGPGLDARLLDQVVVGSFGHVTKTPWPLLEDSLVGLGFAGSILALPIVLSGEPLGVLVAHRMATTLTFDADTADFLVAALAMALTDQLAPDLLEQQLTEDWSSRALIHQATGMVIAQARIGVIDALVLLRAHAYAYAFSLHDVAMQVIDRELSFAEGSP